MSHKAHCLLGVAQAQVSDARRALLEHVVETYLPLHASEEKEFQEMIQTPQFQEVNYLISPYELRGEAAATRAILLLQLRETFGELPECRWHGWRRRRSPGARSACGGFCRPARWKNWTCSDRGNRTRQRVIGDWAGAS